MPQHILQPIQLTLVGTLLLLSVFDEFEDLFHVFESVLQSIDHPFHFQNSLLNRLERGWAKGKRFHRARNPLRRSGRFGM